MASPSFLSYPLFFGFMFSYVLPLLVSVPM
uniref:Uncharacterized protein n=1 Tax=Rhizophora mucronata TaxID=61149 RepID=A0A2P2NQT3_RHIMU